MDNTEIERQFKRLNAKIDAQQKEIDALEKRVSKLEPLKAEIIKYVNNLMKKADTLIRKVDATHGRARIGLRQTLNNVESELSRISRRIK